MSSPFVIKEHTFHGQHIREYPGALANSQEDVLHLHCKSYTPHEVASGQTRGQCTVLAFHANGFHKEVYEPFFEQLYRDLKDNHGVVVGSIWIADQAHQGHSGLLNDQVLGNDPCWWDHSRDVLQMVNTFRSQMKRPLVGIGHSMGGTQAMACAHYHPRLFEAMVMIDPSMTLRQAPTLHAMLEFSLARPDTFKTREKAEKYVLESPFFKAWDKTVRQRYIDTAFHDGPTVLNGESGVLKPITSAHQEVRTLTRPNLNHVGVAAPVDHKQRYTHPDVHKESPLTGPFYNSATRQGYFFLGTLRPPALFVLGKGSKICPPDELEHRTKYTGTKAGGSGGVAAGNVESVSIKGGHFLPMTNVKGTSEVTASFIAKRLGIWKETEAEFQQRWAAQSMAQRQRIQPEEENAMRRWDGKSWKNPHLHPDGGRSLL